jgi:predicted CoA-binding protein
MSDKITLVLGASTDPSRYANKAIKMLRSHGHEVVAVGRDKGKVGDVEILQAIPADIRPDTVTLYINPTIQQSYYEQITVLRPRRIIFNPGTENKDFQTLAEVQGIEPIEACTLVLLTTNQF